MRGGVTVGRGRRHDGVGRGGSGDGVDGGTTVTMGILGVIVRFDGAMVGTMVDVEGYAGALGRGVELSVTPIEVAIGVGMGLGTTRIEVAVGVARAPMDTCVPLPNRFQGRWDRAGTNP